MADEAPNMNIFQIVEALERFIRSNAHSYDDKSRWFAKHIEGGLLVIARQVRSGGLDPEWMEAVKAFRAEELKAEIATKQRDIEILQRDLRKVEAA